MRLYEIDNAIAALIDMETGEIQDYEAFAELTIAREQKIEGIALAMKNALSTSAAIKAEIDTLTARKRTADKTAARLKEYLATALNGEKFSTAKCVISYRKSTAVETDEEFVEWAEKNCADVLVEQPPKLDLVGLKEKLKDGLECPYARIAERQNIQVK